MNHGKNVNVLATDLVDEAIRAFNHLADIVVTVFRNRLTRSWKSPDLACASTDAIDHSCSESRGVAGDVLVD